MGSFIDLTGKKFGRLTVLKRAEDYVSPKGNHLVQWLCKCDCGNHIIAIGSSLKNNHTKSCGCLKNRRNNYDLSGEYGIGYTSKGEEFYFDLEDYDNIKDCCWYIDSVTGYVRTKTNMNSQISMHRLLLPSFKEIDHINHRKNDNRKYNLRKASSSQNNMNIGLRSNNTSGVTGVYKHNAVNKWMSRIYVEGAQIDLGLFDSFEDAVKARKEAEEKYFGEYSYDNSMKTA